jgi:hypothetical protein
MGPVEYIHYSHMHMAVVLSQTENFIYMQAASHVVTYMLNMAKSVLIIHR